MITRRSFGIACGSAACGALSLGAETRQEKGERLVREAFESIGGARFLEIRTQVRSGRAYSFYNRQVRGQAQITIYDRFEDMRPDAGDDWLPLLRREVYTQKGDYYALFLNGQGYEITYRGAVPQPEDYMERYRQASRRDIFFFLRYRLDEPGLYYYYQGTEIVDNVPSEAVDIVDNDGETITLFLRKSDGLPLQQRYLRRDRKTQIPYEEKSVFGRYKPVGDTLLPWVIRRERDNEKVFELYAQSYEANRPLSASIFAIPSDVPVCRPTRNLRSNGRFPSGRPNRDRVSVEVSRRSDCTP